MKNKILQWRFQIKRAYYLTRNGYLGTEIRYRIERILRALGNSWAFKRMGAKKESKYTSARAHQAKRDLSKLDATTEILLHNSGASPLTQSDVSKVNALLADFRRSRAYPAAVRRVPQRPNDWPKGLELPPLPVSSNDFSWNFRRSVSGKHGQGGTPLRGISVIVPTYNRAKILKITLTALVNQGTKIPYEVLVVDDGSQESIESVVDEFRSKLAIRYLWQEDQGYRLSAARNYGITESKYSYIAILDCDMAPSPEWLEAYSKEILKYGSSLALIGPRTCIDSSEINPDRLLVEPGLLNQLSTVSTSNPLDLRPAKGEAIDWRLEDFKKTNELRFSDEPFRFFSGGNICMSKAWFHSVGGFDEDFQDWGGEDNEFAYRLYRAGCFFKYVPAALAYHQEPPGNENETDREEGRKKTSSLLVDRVPIRYRRPKSVDSSQIHRIPLVSIYIPAHNAESTILRAVFSALNQTIWDLEVCICDDGSTDATNSILENFFSKNPRVRWFSQENRGIGAASNEAVRMCRGYYIGQLDSDDYLEPDAVEVCLNEFKKNPALACVYTAYRNYSSSKGFHEGYNWPEFSREKLSTAMICHHFRMFTIRAWNLTDGFDEGLRNAVDYDMFLKLSEVGPFRHVNRVCYNRMLYGKNTSVVDSKEQTKNHFLVANTALERQGIFEWRLKPRNPNDMFCRKHVWVKQDSFEGC